VAAVAIKYIEILILICFACWCWTILSGKNRIKPGEPHYIIVTRNNQDQIEWMVRLLRFHAWLTGKSPFYTFLDASGSAETTAIIHHLMKGREGWLLRGRPNRSGQIRTVPDLPRPDISDEVGPIITIDMRRQEQRSPYFILRPKKEK
jgi:hypothetical protein